MWNLVTLDGFFEGRRSCDIGWHDTVWGEELEKFSLEQSKSIGALLFGRVTYEGMAGYWSKEKGDIANFMNGVPKLVFSKTLARADWNNTKVVKQNAEGEVAKLKKESGNDLYIFGSANLSAAFAEGPDRRVPPLRGPDRPGWRESPVQGEPGTPEVEAHRGEAIEIGRGDPPV